MAAMARSLPEVRHRTRIFLMQVEAVEEVLEVPAAAVPEVRYGSRLHPSFWVRSRLPVAVSTLPEVREGHVCGWMMGITIITIHQPEEVPEEEARVVLPIVMVVTGRAVIIHLQLAAPDA
jgi:hypothetical protein